MKFTPFALRLRMSVDMVRLIRLSIYLRYYSKSYDPSNYNNIIMYNNSVVDNYLRTALTSSDQDTANKNWQLAAWDRNNRIFRKRRCYMDVDGNH